jgi:hypothetical protein
MWQWSCVLFFEVSGGLPFSCCHVLFFFEDFCFGILGNVLLLFRAL